MFSIPSDYNTTNCMNAISAKVFSPHSLHNGDSGQKKAPEGFLVQLLKSAYYFNASCSVHNITEKSKQNKTAVYALWKERSEDSSGQRLLIFDIFLLF